MLRMTVWSLLLGAVAAITGLQLFLAPPATGDKLPVIAWDIASAGTPVGGGLRLQFDTTGKAHVTLPSPGFQSADYPFLHLALADYPDDLTILLLWRSVQTGEDILRYEIQSRPRDSLWLATHELKGWAGEISSFSVEMHGRPGEAVTVTDLTLSPASLPRQLKTIISDWTHFVPWKRASINRLTGVTTVSLLYPVPAMAVFLTLSLLAYGLLLIVFRSKARFNWGVVALIFLFCWMSLDLAWQGKLLRQLGETHRLFAGKTSAQRLAVGPDAELVRFISEVKLQLDSGESRVFVHSSDDYLGLKGAYYLYPANVYWKLRGPPLPNHKYMRSGDYIVLVQPTAVSFDAQNNKLSFTQKRRKLSVQPIISRRAGSLFRVN